MELELPGGAYASNGNYGYGYNGMEKDDELKGSGKLYSTLFREGDTENGRWWSRDPKEMSMPYQSPYILMDANPSIYTDVYGDTVKSSKEDFAVEDEGLDATLGEDHPFSYDEDNGIWQYDKDFDISNYDDTQKELYYKTVEIIDNSLVVNYRVIDGDEGFIAELAKYRGDTPIPEYTLDGLKAGGYTDPIYIKDEKGERQLIGLNIYVHRTTKNRGEASIHETIHTFFFMTRSHLTHPNNFWLTSQFMDRVRNIYIVKADYRWYEKLYNRYLNKLYMFIGKSTVILPGKRSLFDQEGESPRHDTEVEP